MDTQSYKMEPKHIQLLHEGFGLKWLPIVSKNELLMEILFGHC